MMVVDTVVCALTHAGGMLLASRSINDVLIVLNSSPFWLCALILRTILEMHRWTRLHRGARAGLVRIVRYD